MSEVSLKIPQIGEGLQEARLVAFLKQPGDTVKRDEAIYQMETDKAVMDVESPHEGTVVRLLAKPDDVLAIGADVMVMDVVGEGQRPNRSSAGEVTVYVPQIGEGLQEARIVAFLKKPGEAVNRDDAIYQMETDKAVMDVESPYSGTLLRWLAKVDDVLAIGAPVCVLASTDAPCRLLPRRCASLRHRRWLRLLQPRNGETSHRELVPMPRRKELPKLTLDAIPSAGAKLMPGDIDAFWPG